MTRFGIDIGGVLTDSLTNDDTDTSFRSDNFLQTSAVPGSFDAVRDLVQLVGSENAFIISKCGVMIERKTRRWLGYNRFWQHTDFDQANMFFCTERSQKAPIAERLGLDAFVDDRADVLSYMRGIVPYRLLFGPQANPDHGVRGLSVVRNWQEAQAELRQIHARIGQ